jgi:hypothetical protein
MNNFLKPVIITAIRFSTHVGVPNTKLAKGKEKKKRKRQRSELCKQKKLLTHILEFSHHRHVEV